MRSKPSFSIHHRQPRSTLGSWFKARSRAVSLSVSVRDASLHPPVWSAPSKNTRPPTWTCPAAAWCSPAHGGGPVHVTHPDADQRRAGGRVLGQADVVHGLAEDGPVVVLVDEVDEDAGEAHVVGHGLVGVELGGEVQ